MKNRIPDLEQRIIYENNELLIIDKPFDIPRTGRTLLATATSWRDDLGRSSVGC